MTTAHGRYRSKRLTNAAVKDVDHISIWPIQHGIDDCRQRRYRPITSVGAMCCVLLRRLRNQRSSTLQRPSCDGVSQTRRLSRPRLHNERSVAVVDAPRVS